MLYYNTIFKADILCLHIQIKSDNHSFTSKNDVTNTILVFGNFWSLFLLFILELSLYTVCLLTVQSFYLN